MPGDPSPAPDIADLSTIDSFSATARGWSAPPCPAESPTGSWMTFLDGRASQWSPEMYEIFGVDPATFVPEQDTILEHVHPDDAGVVRRHFMSRGRHRGPFALNFRIVRDDGRTRLLEVRGWQDEDEQGEIGRILGTARDITEAEELHVRHDRLSQQQALILRAAGDGICGLDLDGRITFSNPAFAAMARREDEVLAGARLHDLVHRDIDGRELHSPAACPFHQSREDRMAGTDEEFHRGDGSRIEVAYVLVSVADRDFPGNVISFRDVTSRRAAARLLRATLEEVRALSVQRGTLLHDLADAEERERMRIAAELHDDTIQSLDALRLSLESAADPRRPQPTLETVVEAGRQVAEVAQRLRHLMFELMPPEGERDLQAAVETYCGVVLAGSGIAYEVSGGPRRLASDKYLLAYRLAQEAIRNARKHSQGTRLRVEFELTGAELVARVADDGIGMGDALALEPTHAGLRIMRQRAKAAGGSATFGPGLDGRGTTVEFRLPLKWTDAR